MRKPPFERRIQKAEAVAAGAHSLFRRAAEDFEEAARLHKDTYDDLQVQIDALTNMAADAQRSGTRASKNAQKLREFFGE